MPISCVAVLLLGVVQDESGVERCQSRHGVAGPTLQSRKQCDSGSNNNLAELELDYHQQQCQWHQSRPTMQHTSWSGRFQQTTHSSNSRLQVVDAMDWRGIRLESYEHAAATTSSIPAEAGRYGGGAGGDGSGGIVRGSGVNRIITGFHHHRDWFEEDLIRAVGRQDAQQQDGTDDRQQRQSAAQAGTAAANVQLQTPQQRHGSQLPHAAEQPTDNLHQQHDDSQRDLQLQQSRPQQRYHYHQTRGNTRRDNVVPVGDGIARHGLSLRSAYYQVLGSEPAFTSSHHKFRGTLDYIWYSPQAGSCKLQPVSVLLPPGRKCLSKRGGLPNVHIPSDHISLVCDFVVNCK